MSRKHRRGLRPIAAAVLALAGIAMTASPGLAGASDAFPVTIKHKYGSTTIEQRPTRVVTLGQSDHEPVLALGVVPVGVDDWFGERPFGKWPWASELWQGKKPTVVGKREDIDLEKVAALDPDLILALYSGITEKQYDQLSKIAPTVAQPRKYADWAAPWQVMTRIVGRALGESAKAEALIQGIEQRFAAIRAEHPEFAGQQIAVVDPYQPGRYAVFAPYDQKVLLLKELGFTDSPRIAELAGDEYAAEISNERLDLLDVDRVIFLTSDPEAQERIEADEVYQTLEVARDGRALFISYEDPPIGAALSFNTVLSIPYALDALVPLLAQR